MCRGIDARGMPPGSILAAGARTRLRHLTRVDMTVSGLDPADGVAGPRSGCAVVR